MNFVSIISLLLAAAVFLLSVITSTDNPMAMVDFHGALIVVGGSIAAAAISFGITNVWLMVKVFVQRTIFGKTPNYSQTIKHLMEIADAYRNESSNLKTLIESNADPFLKESLSIILDGVANEEEAILILKKRSETLYQRYSRDALRFKSMGKYPPAMGLMGAVLGMIALLGSLGKPGAESSIGPAMSVALIATFYGIAVANLMIIPISENLAESANELRIKNDIIIHGCSLILKKTNSILLAEELNSYLLPKERIKEG